MHRTAYRASLEPRPRRSALKKLVASKSQASKGHKKGKSRPRSTNAQTGKQDGTEPVRAEVRPTHVEIGRVIR